MLIEKDVWDLIEDGPRQPLAALWEQKIKENRMAVGIATRTIKEGVSDDIFNNIIDITDLQEMWEKLRTACSQVGQGVVYSILQEILNYAQINKPKGFEKPVMSRFADVQFLVKRLQAAITPNRDIWDGISIAVTLDSLHNDFDIITESMLEWGDKSIDKMQQILASAEAKFISKRATGVTGDLAMSKGRNSTAKKRANSDDKCFNCGKLGHWGRDCTLPDHRAKWSKSDKSSSSKQRQAKRNRANIAAFSDDDSDPEPFRPGKANMVKEKESSQQPPKGVWYLDSCAFRHRTNNRDLFIEDLCPKCLDFTTAGGQTLRAKSIGTIAIPLADGSSIRLEGVAYAPECDSNLISLGQLRESKITYVNNPNAMTLMQGGQAIAHARRDRNLFILDLVSSNKVMQAAQPQKSIQPSRAMAIQGRGSSTHLVSKNKRVRIWHRRFGHASNARVIRASRLLIGMGNFDVEYDSAEVYSDSEESEPEDERLLSPLTSPPSPSAATPPAKFDSGSLETNIACTTIDNDFDSLCSPCVASNQTRVVVRSKPMTKVDGKLDEVHVDLWGPHHPASLSGKSYAAILLDAKTRKTWVIYLRSKDEFVDAFQIWLPKVENECNQSMKPLRADGGGEFISAKLKDICDKKGIIIK